MMTTAASIWRRFSEMRQWMIGESIRLERSSGCFQNCNISFVLTRFLISLSIAWWTWHTSRSSMADSARHLPFIRTKKREIKWVRWWRRKESRLVATHCINKIPCLCTGVSWYDMIVYLERVEQPLIEMWGTYYLFFFSFLPFSREASYLVAQNFREVKYCKKSYPILHWAIEIQWNEVCFSSLPYFFLHTSTSHSCSFQWKLSWEGMHTLPRAMEILVIQWGCCPMPREEFTSIRATQWCIFEETEEWEKLDRLWNE